MIEKYLACPDSPITAVDREESRPGALLSRKWPQCPKEKTDWPSTAINTGVPQVQLGWELVWGPWDIFSPDYLESLTPGSYTSGGSLCSSMVPRPDLELGAA